MEPYNNYNIGELLVLHVTEEARQRFISALEDDGTFDFADFGEDDVKVLSNSPLVGRGEIV